MTVSSTLEAKLRERGSSSAPADAAGKVLGVQPRDPDGQARFFTVVHWATARRGARARAAGPAGLDGGKAAAAHFAAIWGSAQVMLPALNVAPPLWKSEPKEIAVDAFHHAFYAVATGVAFAALERSSSHAKFTGEVGVCLATSGPGAIHLLNGLYDAKLDHQPVVAIVGQQAQTALGGNYQQEVDLAWLRPPHPGNRVTLADECDAFWDTDRALRLHAVRQPPGEHRLHQAHPDRDPRGGRDVGGRNSAARAGGRSVRPG